MVKKTSRVVVDHEKDVSFLRGFITTCRDAWFVIQRQMLTR